MTNPLFDLEPLRRQGFDTRKLTEGEGDLADRLVRQGLSYIEPLPEELQRDKERCEASLLALARGAWHVLEPDNLYVDGWHVGCICEHLEAMTALQIARLFINVPPRHMKSLLACVFWFCWVWAKAPSARWLFSSYSADLAFRDSQKCLDVIKSPWYQARWANAFRLRPGQRSMGKFGNDKQGYRIATSVGGRGTGEGGDYVVTDDPQKAGDVYSEVYRNRVARWWGETMSTRGNDPRGVRKLGIQQRLHERDLTGHVREMAEAAEYEVLVLPARYEPKRYFFARADAMPDGKTLTRGAIVLTSLQRERPHLRDPRTEEGQPLWPERYGDAELRGLEAELRQFGTSGQLQQNPSPAAGESFRRADFRYYTEEAVELEPGAPAVPCYVLHHSGGRPPTRVPKRDCTVFQVADTAVTVNTDSKYTALLTAVLCPVFRAGDCLARYLLFADADRDRLTVPEQYAYLDAYRDRFPESVLMGVEPKASGLGLIQQALADGKPFLSLPAAAGGGDSPDAKVRRAAALTVLYSNHAVFHNQGMRELANFEDELLAFPRGSYDDWVDCASYAAILHNSERILNTSRPLVCAAPGELGLTPPRQEVYNVHGVQVTFQDDPDWWEAQ
ncbi:MAG TPA: hypothetical protein VJ739_06025 [Gemmataceae bacterium]|nr:hypothetical protein [Gemmataceae bacterium]